MEMNKMYVGCEMSSIMLSVCTQLGAYILAHIKITQHK